MNPHTHFLFPFTIAFILSKFNVISWKLTVFCGIIGVLVDLDHYVEHIIHAKSNKFSLRATWNNSEKFHKFSQRSFVHYWFGAVLVGAVLIVLALFSWKVALAIAIGYYSHLFLDWLNQFRNRWYKWKVGPLFMKESNLEVVIDIALVIILVFIFLF